VLNVTDEKLCAGMLNLKSGVRCWTSPMKSYVPASSRYRSWFC